MTPIQIATFKFVAERRTVNGRHQAVDLREISEPMRQRIIDLAMMEPPLVNVEADKVFLTGHGYVKLADYADELKPGTYRGPSTPPPADRGDTT